MTVQITRYTKDRVNTNLVETLPHIPPKSDLLNNFFSCSSFCMLV
jgi:hypothetical protein